MAAKTKILFVRVETAFFKRVQAHLRARARAAGVKASDIHRQILSEDMTKNKTVTRTKTGQP